jgi:EAL domain-containing protein (putative c-di-GMP-specific phosphodiesterase class I)
VHFALDDFGTGYSSLSYLKRLPVAQLKIDQTFINGMLDAPSDVSILQAILGLASAFGREVIAEGVNSAAQAAQLLHLGCEVAQGYGIAQPMPPSAIHDWIVNWSKDPRLHA